jgi:hypothetical protein
MTTDNRAQDYKSSVEDTTSTETIKIALKILGAINAVFASGTQEERRVLRRILQIAQEGGD